MNRRAQHERRAAALAEWAQGNVTHDELAKRYGVSRQAVTTWIAEHKRASDAAPIHVTVTPSALIPMLQEPKPGTLGPREPAQVVAARTITPKRRDRLRFVCDLLTGTPEFPPLPSSQLERVLRDAWKITSRQARRYITDGRTMLAASFNGENGDAVRASTDSVLLQAVAIAQAKGDPHGMILAAQRRAELHGVFQQKVRLDHVVSGLADLIHECDEESENAKPGDESKASAAT